MAEPQYIVPLDAETKASLDKIKAELKSLAQDVIANRVSKEEAAAKLQGLTACENTVIERAIEELFKHVFEPKALAQQYEKELKARWKPYSLAEGLGCIRAYLRDTGSVTSEQQKRDYIRVVGNLIRENEFDKYDL